MRTTCRPLTTISHAQVAHMHELDRRESRAGSNVSAYSLRPGLVSSHMVTSGTTVDEERRYCESRERVRRGSLKYRDILMMRLTYIA